MDHVIFLTLAFIYLIFIGYIIQLSIGGNWNIITIPTLLLLIGLFYDSIILGIGRYIGQSIFLSQLNQARYILHSVLTPLLIFFSWGVLKYTEVKWAKKPLVILITIMLTIILFIIEYITNVSDLSLVATWCYGVLSFEPVESHSPLPIMVIGVSMVLMISSIIIWRRLKWKWLFIGILSMSFGNVIKPPFKTNVIHNVFELFLVISIIFTIKFLLSIKEKH